MWGLWRKTVRVVEQPIISCHEATLTALPSDAKVIFVAPVDEDCEIDADGANEIKGMIEKVTGIPTIVFSGPMDIRVIRKSELEP